MQKRIYPEKNILIRKAKPEDVAPVFKIENQQFPNPWKKQHFYHEVDHDISFFYVVQEIDAPHIHIFGYIIFWLIDDLIELHNIAVESSFKNRGIGSTLLKFLLDVAVSNHVNEVFLEVRSSNSEAIGFYEKHSFRKVSVRKNYYSEPKEDAWIYVFKL
jgi:ribosomal-protein-alanine N-acetyltransferase